MNETTILKSETVLKTELFAVKKLKLVLPTGSKRTHYIAERIPIACILPINEKYEIYLVSQYRYLLEKTMLEAVAGHVEKNETPFAAAKRELKEETGIKASQWEDLAKIEMGASAFKSKVHLFLARGLKTGIAEPMEGECIKVVKIPLEEALVKVMRGEINHSVTMLGILLLDKLKREKRI